MAEEVSLSNEDKMWVRVPRLLLGFGLPTLELMRLAAKVNVLDEKNMDNSNYKDYVKRRNTMGIDAPISSLLSDAQKEGIISEGNPYTHEKEERTGYYFPLENKQVFNGQLEKIDRNLEELAISVYPYELYFGKDKISAKRIIESLIKDMMACLMLEVFTGKDDKYLLGTAKANGFKPANLYVGMAVDAIDKAVKEGIYNTLVLDSTLITPPYENVFRRYMKKEDKKSKISTDQDLNTAN